MGIRVVRRARVRVEPRSRQPTNRCASAARRSIRVGVGFERAHRAARHRIVDTTPKPS
jgi:hypothetical protein